MKHLNSPLCGVERLYYRMCLKELVDNKSQKVGSLFD
jgi:hypothetical protein